MILPVGFNSVTWSTNAIVAIMFKRSYGFSVRMIFAFVFAIILFPSEIQSCCQSAVGLHLPFAASGLWRQQGSPRGGGWVLPRAVLLPLDADPRGIGASKGLPPFYCSAWAAFPDAGGSLSPCKDSEIRRMLILVWCIIFSLKEVLSKRKKVT